MVQRASLKLWQPDGFSRSESVARVNPPTRGIRARYCAGLPGALSIRVGEGTAQSLRLLVCPDLRLQFAK